MPHEFNKRSTLGLTIGANAKSIERPRAAHSLARSVAARSSQDPAPWSRLICRDCVRWGLADWLTTASLKWDRPVPLLLAERYRPPRSK